MDLTSLVINVLPIYAMGMLVLSAFIAIWNIRKVINLIKDTTDNYRYPRDRIDSNTDEVFGDNFSSVRESYKKKDDWHDPKYGFGTKFLY